MKNLFWIVALLFSVVLVQSCQKEEVTDLPPGVEAPELPPMAMFTMPTGDFDPNTVDTSGVNTQLDERGFNDTYWNWFHAAVSLVVWHAVIVVNMAAPTAAFGAAFNVQPEYIGDLTFEWAYEYVAPVNLGGHTYNVSLTGQYNPDFETVNWVMTLSQVGGYTDFVWYTGTTSANNSEAQFTLNHQPFNPQSYLLAQYQGDNAGNETLRFTNIIPGNPGNGDYVEYRTNPGATYDLAFDVLTQTDNFLEIEWNEQNIEGRVRHPQHFNDNEWHCWDGEYKDVDCN